ncbi:hypothetical protein J3R82DRAFT_2126, partial [Butyriboletus roseoflavus]
VEIKLTASFDLEKSSEVLCVSPIAKSLIVLSHITNNALEQACMQYINNLFTKEYLPAIHE